MAVALTSSYADTTLTDSFTFGGNIELNASGAGSSVRLDLRGKGFIGGGQINWILRELFSFDGVNYHSDLQLTQPLGDNLGSFPPLPTIIQSINHGPAPPPANTFFAAVSFSALIGPFRLGARYDTSVSSGPGLAPLQLADTNVLRYAWFADEASFFNETVGGVNETRQIALTPTIQTLDVSRFSCTGTSSGSLVGAPIAKFTSVTFDVFPLDTDGINDAPLLYPHYSQVTAGAFNINDTPVGAFLEAAPGGQVTYALTMLDYSGATVTPNLLDNWLTQPETFHAAPKSPQQSFLTNGTAGTQFQTNYPRATKNLPGAVTHSISISTSPAWLAANGYDPNDLTVVLDQHSPITGSATYSPILIEQKGAIEIDTPAGGRPSHWAINSGANGSVTENAGDTVFVVSNVAARFVRNYATNWRNYSTGTRFSPEWVVDGYTFVRRHYGIDFRGVAQTTYPEDYWWWNSYMFLRLNITATAAATCTLVVTGVDLHVTDNHSPIPGVRSAGLTFSAFNDTRTYLASVPIGTNNVWIDLSFPDSYIATGGAVFPMRRPRVESLNLSFDTVGTYTLNAMELSRRDPAGYATEVSVAYSPQSSYNEEWPCVYLRTDGEATPILTYGDTYRKGMEAELGGAVRFAGDNSGVVALATEMWSQFQRIEGFTVTYTDSARAAFMRDTYGVSIASQIAQLAVEVAPGAVFVGAGDAHGYSPAFALRCGAVSFPNGLDVIVRPRHIFGGGVEAVAMVDGTRGGAGLPFDVLDQANTTLGTVNSDARGRIHFEPIGHGKAVRFEPA